MYDQIGVPTDGTGEMRVDVGSEAVMTEFWGRVGSGAEVFGRHHASGCHYSDEGVEVGFVRVDAAV